MTRAYGAQVIWCLKLVEIACGSVRLESPAKPSWLSRLSLGCRLNSMAVYKEIGAVKNSTDLFQIKSILESDT
jgi:hypothetical protein